MKSLQDGAVACLQVKVWFQNQRMKWRDSNERQLMSLSCSQDTTSAMTRHVTASLAHPIDRRVLKST